MLGRLFSSSLVSSSEDIDDHIDVETEEKDEAKPTRAASTTVLKKKVKEVAYSHPRLIHTLKGFSEPVTSASISQDGQFAAGVASDRSLRVFHGLHLSGTPSAMFAEVHLDSGTALSLSANGRNILVATEASRQVYAYTFTPPNQKIKAGLVFKRQFPPNKPAHSTTICSIILAPNSKFIATVGEGDDLTIRLWSLNGDPIAVAHNKQLKQNGASISADSKFIAVAAESANPGRTVAPRHGQVAVLEVGYDVKGNAYKLDQVMCIGGHTKGIRDVSFASDCVHLALGARNGEWTVWRTDVKYELKVEPEECARGQVSSGNLERVALSPFATRLVATCMSQIHLFNVASGRVLETIESGHTRVNSLSYSSDGLRLLTGGQDGKLRLWRLEDDESKAGKL